MNEVDVSAAFEGFKKAWQKFARALVVIEDTLRLIFADLHWTLDEIFSGLDPLLMDEMKGTDTMNDHGLHMNHSYRVRLKGSDDGGWKGNPDHFGMFEVHGNPGADSEKILVVNIPSVSPTGVKYILKEIVHFPQLKGETKEIVLDVKDLDGTTRRFFFEIHRDSIPDLVSYRRVDGELKLCSAVLNEMVAAGSSIPHVIQSALMLSLDNCPDAGHEDGNTTNGLCDFARDIDCAMETIPCEISDEGRATLELYESLINTEPETTAGPRSRAYGIALLRRAARNPGMPIDIRPPTWLSTNKVMRVLVEGLLKLTGLGRFAALGRNALLVYRPDELPGDQTYDYARAREPFLTDVADFNIPIGPQNAAVLPNTSPGGAIDLPGMDEALALNKKMLSKE